MVYFKKLIYDYVGSNFHFVCFKLNGKSYFLFFLLFKHCRKVKNKGSIAKGQEDL